MSAGKGTVTGQAGDAEGSGFLLPEYQALFGSQWTPWAGGLLIGLLNVMMFAYAKPWAVSEGVMNWGNWLLAAFDLPVGEQSPPWLFTTSVTNLSLILGALIAALLSRQFAFRITNLRDIVRSVIGGVLLGIGAVLGIGCTIGGFLSAFSALSLAGPLFMLGLFGGAYVGLKILVWDLAREAPRTPAPVNSRKKSAIDWYRYQPHIGVALLALLLVLVVLDGTEFTYAGITGHRSVLVLLGIALGIVNQRTRFCMVRAFRDPFMTGDGEMTKGAALALMVGVAGFSIIKGSDLSDVRAVEEFVNPSVFVGSISGGLIFGIGMVLAGGCASGSLWRAGEGQFKFFLVLAAFSVSSALFSLLLASTNAREKWGDDSYFLPDFINWPGAILMLAGIALGWFVLAAWNEKSGKLVVG